jgi:hypothetical protein
MANLCSGEIVFVKPKQKLRSFLYRINDRDISLESFVCPMPQEIKDSMNSDGKDDSRYYRSIENWWSKRGTYSNYVQRDWDGNIRFFFVTAWSPIKDNIIAELAKYCNSLIYKFDEWGMYFSGIRKYVDWELEISEDYDDPYYGQGIKCDKCGTLNPKENDECMECGHQW